MDDYGGKGGGLNPLSLFKPTRISQKQGKTSCSIKLKHYEHSARGPEGSCGGGSARGSDAARIREE